MKRTSERGSALIITTILVLVLAATSVALVTEVAVSQKRSHESRDADEGYVIARTGLERTRRAMHQYYATAAWNPLLLNGAPQWSDVLAYNDPNQVPGARVFSTNAVDFEQLVRQNFDAVKGGAAFVAYRADPNAPGAATTPESPIKTSPLVIFGQCSPYRNGGYHVAIRNNATDPGGPLTDTDRTIVATVTSVLEDASRTVRRLEADLYYDLGYFQPQGGVETEGGVNWSGNGKLSGTEGNILTGQNLVISGNPIISGDALATGSLNISGSPVVAGTLAGGQPPVDVPPIVPADFYDDRDYLMRADGRIFNKAGTMIHNGSGGAMWHGFKYNGGAGPKWELLTPSGDGLPPPATFYIEGYLVVATNIGNGPGDPPVRATFVATKSVEISGNPGLAPYLGDVQIIAGTDIKIGGSPDLGDYQGFYGAHEQILISGNPKIFGSLCAENAASTDTMVTLAPIGGSQMGVQISGDPDIIFNGNLNTMIGAPAKVEILQLRLIR